MKIKVLGSSSSGNCYLLQSKNETLIIECGINYKEILKGLNFNLKNVVGCLITHEHKDHCKSIREILKAGINVYTSLGTARSIAKDYNYIETYHRLNFIRNEEAIRIGEFIVLPFQVQHDAAEPLGFLIYHKKMGNLLFITDSYYCKYRFPMIDHVFIECNFSLKIARENKFEQIDRLMRSHFELDNVKDFLKASDLSKVKEIVLIHLSNSNSNAKEFKEEIEGISGKPVYVADKGLEIDLEVQHDN